jgi:hypothetical protein
MADPVGGCSVATGEGCHADNSIHTYCYGGGFPATLEDEADYAMDKAIDRDTILSDDFESICNTTIDVKWLAADLGPGVRGDYMCLDPNGLEGSRRVMRGGSD